MVVGHEAIQERLERSIGREKVAHAYLFYGPENVGKYTLAKEFACQIIGKTGFPGREIHDPVDLLILEPEREEEKGVVKEKDISVEAVRESLHQLALAPYVGEYRVLLIDQAHRLTESAQNALLKTLEEPPQHAVLVLVTHRFGVLLPTLISRCQREAFQLVSQENMRRFIREKGFALGKNDAWLLEMGRPGLVEVVVNNDNSSVAWKTYLESLLTLSVSPLRDRLGLAEVLASNPYESIRLLEWWQGILHAQALQGNDEDVHQWFSAVEDLEEALRMLRKAPGGTRLVLENLFIQWKLGV